MGERAETIGASLSIESRRGQGTLVIVSAPEVVGVVGARELITQVARENPRWVL